MEHRLLERFRKNADGSYLIELRVREIDDLFNPLDPSPLHERDINDKIIEKLYNDIVIFPKDVPVDIIFRMPKHWKKIHGLEHTIREAMKKQFEYTAISSSIHLRRRLKKGLKTLLVAGIMFISLIAISTSLTIFYPESVLAHVVAEGLFVLSWVSLWRPIEVLLYEWLPLFEERKRHERILKMNVHFSYE